MVSQKLVGKECRDQVRLWEMWVLCGFVEHDTGVR